MKKLLIFSLISAVFCGGVFADDAADIARAAARATGAVAAESQVRGKSTSPAAPAAKIENRRAASTATVVERAAAATPQISARSATPIIAARGAPAAPATARVALRPANPAIATATRAATARAAETTESPTTARRDYTKCREAYFQCMDEICANKDANLKRCACSARLHEFDGMKKKMREVEDGLNEFNQKLLAVSMDAEDVNAMMTATEGERAFLKSDKSASQKILDEIMGKLKSDFREEVSTNALSAINLSMDMDSMFDSVDSFSGARTASKEGEALYQDALPICRSIAAEVCDADSVGIAQSAYKTRIEQDCNTVAKTYEAKRTEALSKLNDSAALLDIARLDTYQAKNSDNTLTCRKKMLDILTDTNVCGTGLGKCLDWSGRYINPTTGEAILSADLSQLGGMLTRPNGDMTWSGTAGNERFVSFLNSKKKYIAPATKNCQDIADKIWSDFVEDALGQIKLAQEDKLKTLVESCTELTTACIGDATAQLTEMDSRALSLFGVRTDRLSNEMCVKIKSSCGALIDAGGSSGDAWKTGVENIAADKTFDQIVKTCTQVGQQCVINKCTSISGNFGLCMLAESVQRQFIVNPNSSCFTEVKECVNSANTGTLATIMTNFGKSALASSNFFDKMYANMNISDSPNFAGCTQTSLPAPATNYPIVAGCPVYFSPKTECAALCASGSDPNGCYVCRISEYIWGNCENTIYINGGTGTSFDNIICVGGTFDKQTGICSTGGNSAMPKVKRILPSQNTILSWFAKNTLTDQTINSCYASDCRPGQVQAWNGGNFVCVAAGTTTSDGSVSTNQFSINSATPPWTNNCHTNVRDSFGNCCAGNITNNTQWRLPFDMQSFASGNAVPPYYYADPADVKTKAISGGTPSADDTKICASTSAVDGIQFVGKIGADEYLLCVGKGGTNPGQFSVELNTITNEYEIQCNGRYVVMNSAAGSYKYQSTSDIGSFYFYSTGHSVCTLNGSTFSSSESTADCTAVISGAPTNADNNLFFESGYLMGN
ncbi:MAG: hypothetical protein LBO08_02515 [Rickettsiales bacterium]|jgi:hypothetical protein|nr:hypothetical protein [Rickettsiales bacterium]